MATLADKIMDDNRIWVPPWCLHDEKMPTIIHGLNRSTFASLSRRPPIIDINNVMQHTLREIVNGKVWLRDLPCLAPPFEEFWCEAEVTITHVAEDGSEDPARKPARFGVLVIDSTNLPNAAMSKVVTDARPESFQWELDAFVYIEIDRKVFGPFATWKFWIDDRGKCIEELFLTTDVNRSMPQAMTDQMESSIYQTVLAAMWAVSFMHCKNSVMEKIEVPEKVDRKHFKRHGRPYFKRQVIKIDTVKNAVERINSGGTSNGSEIAWHIVPGMFRDYRKNGLFGQHHGIFWFPPHARGSKSRGVNQNDYEASSASE